MMLPVRPLPTLNLLSGVTMIRLFRQATILLLAAGTPVWAQSDATPLFNLPVADSNPLRTEQARELDEYIKHVARDRSRFQKLFQPLRPTP